ncbi:MAG TPA: hypothetical protein VMM58_13060 [Bacteroidota bacterium]|nr:hypothetical protein [Bacteroidota bacterium]
MKKSIWFMLGATAAMMVAFAVTRIVVRGAKPHVLAFGTKSHESKNFNSFPIDIPTTEFDDWLS